MAEDEDESSKTEEPSDRKIQKSRDEGDVPISQEVKSWFLLLSAMFLLWGLSPIMMRDVSSMSLKFIAEPHLIPMDRGHLYILFFQVVKQIALILFMPMALSFILALIAGLIQTGFMYAPKKLEPDFKKINPFNGLKNFFSVRKLIEALKGFFKVGAVIFGASLVLGPKLRMVPSLLQMEPTQILDVIHEILLLIIFAVVLIVMIIAAADYFYQRYSHRQKLKMTKQEVKEEYKQMEGDPLVKAKIRQIRNERFRKRMMAAVPEADVVVTNPTHYAIAMKYDMDGMEAPLVVAKGVDHLAQRIREIAEENEVPLVENPPLARALYASVEVDEQIPPEHFKAVAEVIAYVMRLKQKMSS